MIWREVLGEELRFSVGTVEVEFTVQLFRDRKDDGELICYPVHGTRLVKLLGRDASLEELNRELARQLRHGGRDESDAALMAHLEATVADKISIANPKWR